MKFRKYSHKFTEVVTKRFVLRIIDKTEDMPKSEVRLEMSGTFKETATMSQDEAMELYKALGKILGVKDGKA